MARSDDMKPKNTLKKKKISPGREELRRRKLYHAGLIVILILAFIAAVLAWNHFRPSSNGGQDFIQQNADTPLYVLVVGIDDNDQPQANFIGLAAVNKDKRVVDFIILPDNTKIEGRREKGTQALQDVYSEGGLSLTQAVVEDIFKIPVPYYVSFTASSFAQFIDTCGGMPLYVEKPMYHENSSGQADISLNQGYQMLNGEEACGYLRFIDQDGPLSRTLRQERFVKAFYEERENHFGLTNAVDIYRAWNYVDSNIPAKEMARLAWDFRNVPVSDIHFYMLPGETAKSGETKTATASTLWNFDPVEVQKIIGTANNSIVSAPETDVQQDPRTP